MGSKILKWELQPWGKMAQWWFHSTMECPQCKAPVKDKEHIVVCPVNLAQETWTQSLASLQKWTREQQTDHTIISTLILGLQHWHDNRDIPDSELVSLLIQAQAQISWEFVLDGWLTKQWQYHQEQTWQVVQSFHSSRQWMTELIKNSGMWLGICGCITMTSYTPCLKLRRLSSNLRPINKFRKFMLLDPKLSLGLFFIFCGTQWKRYCSFW